MKYGINTKINSCGKVISSCLEDYKRLHAFHMYIYWAGVANDWNDEETFYFGLTDNIFKERYRNQITIEILNIRPWNYNTNRNNM